MNLRELKKHQGATVRLRPIPLRVDGQGQSLPQLDDDWRIDAMIDKPNRLRLCNIPTGHTVELQSDNVKQFQSPRFLLLRCELTLTPREVLIEPLPPSGRQALPIARYQRGGPAITSRHIPARPEVCTGCTAAVQFRPLTRVRLVSPNSSAEPEEQFCPSCARRRGLPPPAPVGMADEVLYADMNPSLRYHVARLLKHWALKALSADRELSARGVTSVGAAVTARSVTLMVSGSWRGVIEVPLALADLKDPVWESDVALLAFLKERLIAALVR